MKTLLAFFPFGTIRGTLLCYFMSAFYGFIGVLLLIISIIKDRKTFFYVKSRTEIPKCLTDKRLGEHNYVELKDLKLHYVSNGDSTKPLMLFLHGFPEIWYSWRIQLREFGKSYYAVAIDMRGYGDSDKPKGVIHYSIDKLINDVKDVVNALGHKKCVLVAHDWGGVIAWLVAAEYPHLVEKLIIMNAPHIKYWFNTIKTDWNQFFKSWYIFFFNIPYLPELMAISNDLNFFNEMFKNNTTEEELEGYKYYYSKPYGLTGSMNYYRALQRGNSWVGYLNRIQEKTITSPTLVIWGKNDLALQQSLAYDSCKQCDKYTVKLIDDCSHWVQFEKPQVVNQYMKEFLNE